jgi:hypothetical protein
VAVKVKVKSKKGLSLIECKKRVTIRFINPILGSAPASKELYNNFLLTKLNKEIDKLERKIEQTKDYHERLILLNKKEDLENQLANLPDIKESELGKIMVFYRAKYEDFDVPVIRGHQVLGFLKEAGYNFKDALGIKGLREKISRYVRVMPYDLYIYQDYVAPENIVDDVDGILDRPLKASTPQGVKVSISRSEIIYSKRDKVIQFELWLYKNKEVTWDILEILMREYGITNGISPWRNTGYYGAFEVVEVENIE